MPPEIVPDEHGRDARAHTERILVTGGGGFIGGHLVERLLADGHRVTVLDNFSTGDRANLDKVALHPRLEVVHGSVLDEVALDEVVDSVDRVVHLAAAVGVRMIMEQPLRSFHTNVRGAENVLASAHRFRRPVLLMSTSEIYGRNTDDALNEDSDCLHGPPSVVRWAYSTAKAVDEILGNLYFKERGLPVTIVRLFNTVGPRQSASYGMVLPALVEQALDGRPITIYGDGLQTRCFLHVDDAVSALCALLHFPGAAGVTVNVGSREEVSILELALRVKVATGSDSPILHMPYHLVYSDGFEDMRRRRPDTDRIRQLVGWTPTIRLDEIIADVVAASRCLVAR